MATADSVKSKLQGMIDQANAATGGGNVDLTSALSDLIAGYGQGGGADIYIEDLLTFAQDMTINEVMAAAPYKLHYQNSMIFLIATGTVAPSSGSYSLNNFWIMHSGTQIKKGIDQYLSVVPPDTFKFFGGNWEAQNFFRISYDGVLSSSYNGTSNVGGPGTVIHAIEIPINVATWAGWVADGTLWGDGT